VELLHQLSQLHSDTTADVFADSWVKCGCGWIFVVFIPLRQAYTTESL